MCAFFSRSSAAICRSRSRTCASRSRITLSRPATSACRNAMPSSRSRMTPARRRISLRPPRHGGLPRSGGRDGRPRPTLARRKLPELLAQDLVARLPRVLPRDLTPAVGRGTGRDALFDRALERLHELVRRLVERDDVGVGLELRKPAGDDRLSGREVLEDLDGIRGLGQRGAPERDRADVEGGEPGRQIGIRNLARPMDVREPVERGEVRSPRACRPRARRTSRGGAPRLRGRPPRRTRPRSLRSSRSPDAAAWTAGSRRATAGARSGARRPRSEHAGRRGGGASSRSSSLRDVARTRSAPRISRSSSAAVCSPCVPKPVCSSMQSYTSRQPSASASRRASGSQDGYCTRRTASRIRCCSDSSRTAVRACSSVSPSSERE